MTVHDPALAAYLDTFGEETGYLDFARVGPISATAAAEQSAASELLARARAGTLDTLSEQDARVRRPSPPSCGSRPSRSSSSRTPRPG